MGSALSNALSNVIKALKLIEKDSIEVYLHFHVINGKSSEISFFLIFQFLPLWENEIDKRKSIFFFRVAEPVDFYSQRDFYHPFENSENVLIKEFYEDIFFTKRK